jgi:hypothetical protein
MSIKNRIVKLEDAAGIGARLKYLCVITPSWAEGWDSPREKANGYKIQPCTREYGGTGGEPFYLATREELEAFQARPDVDLDIIEIVYTDTPLPGENENGQD